MAELFKQRRPGAKSARMVGIHPRERAAAETPVRPGRVSDTADDGRPPVGRPKAPTPRPVLRAHTWPSCLEDAFMELTADSIEYMTLMLVAGSMGALTVISEHSSGLIRTTLAAVPARGAVVLAKAVVTALLWTAVGTAAAIGSFLVSQAILDGHGAAVPITHPDVLRPLVPSALLAPVCAVTGLGLAVLRRHAAATLLTSAFTLLMLPTMFSESNRWSADIKHTTVSAAWTRLVQTWKPDPGSLGYTATFPGSWIVYALWPLTAVALAVAVVRHRDV